jgi:hypothetical protein
MLLPRKLLLCFGIDLAFVCNAPHAIDSFTAKINSSWIVNQRLDRQEARSLLDEEDLLPSQKYSDRIGLGRAAQGIDNNLGPLKSDDPRLAMTYAEFPLESFDILLDAGCRHLDMTKKHRSQETQNSPTIFLDIGFGLGRIVMYTSLTRGRPEMKYENDKIWKVYGIEISPVLHDMGLQLVQKGVDRDLWSSRPNNDIMDNQNSFSLHLGPAEEFKDSVLSDVDIIFAYSTAFSAKKFSPEVGALILDPEWSDLLGKACQPGCIAITTDRALDPLYGWKVLEIIDVQNPEVFGSTGYIHVKE